VSPDVGELDDAALAELAEEDLDAALELLAEMSGATDRRLAALAARLAGRLVLDVARSGPVSARGLGRMTSLPADRAEGDLDLDGSLEGIVEARASGRGTALDELRVRTWRRPATALALVVDRSGSMNGHRLATAAVAAAAISWRAPSDWSVLAFGEKVLAVKSQDRHRSAGEVVDDVLRLRGHGTTDLAAALGSAAAQLERSNAKRQITVLLSDCRATAGAAAEPVARRLDELCILAPSDDAEDAREFAAAVGARLATIAGPADVASALSALL
jgi:hypothetical protein